MDNITWAKRVVLKVFIGWAERVIADPNWGLQDAFRQAGIKGDYGASTCPVAIFLKRNLEFAGIEGIKVSVTTEDIMFSFYDDKIDNPSFVKKFIVAFDENEFPDLFNLRR